MARVTLSYPDVEDWDIVPATVEFPVHSGRWWALLGEHIHWVALALLFAGVVWGVIRKRTRRAQTGGDA